MRPSIGIALLTCLFVAGESSAQFHGGFGPPRGVVAQSGTYGFVSRNRSVSVYESRFGVVGPLPPTWYFGPTYPFYQPYVLQPPIVIQNIIQPGVLPPVARRPEIPPEFEPPPAKAIPPKAKLGPAPKVVDIPVPEPPKPALGNRAEADRIADAASKAFADGQYGRALELFRKVIAFTPQEPSAHFHISQALFALGKYREAVAAIAVGMELRADWSEARFAVRELYWKDPAVYDEHLNALRQAVAMFPDDASLLFLLGHQLWFDGKQDEAKALIAKAKEIGNGKTPAGGFKVR